ncbi:MAG: metal-sulfur cluster assembly factor [Bacillota bacterium]|nr:MAG: aromatic ring hydroxylase [Bacillota bacterium]
MPTKEEVMKALEVVKDPELRINVVDLGLVYNVNIDGGKVEVDMTLTTPACPVGPMIVSQAEAVLRRLPGVEEARVNLVWDPPWTPDMMSERLKKARAMGLLP